MILTVLETSSFAPKKYNRNADNYKNNNRRLSVDLVAKKRSEAVDAGSARRLRPIPVIALGLGASLVCACLFLVFVLSASLMPSLRETHHALNWILPGFSFANIGRVLLGLIESFAWGLYSALILGGTYNYVATRKS